MDNANKAAAQLYKVEVGLIIEMPSQVLADLRAAVNEHEPSLDISDVALVGTAVAANIEIAGGPIGRALRIIDCRKLSPIMNLVLKATGVLGLVMALHIGALT